MRFQLWLVFLIFMNSLSLYPQLPETNYDESLILEYTLPDPLMFFSGKKVTTKSEWSLRRDEIFLMFENFIFGESPKWDGEIESVTISKNMNALDNLAERKEIIIKLKKDETTIQASLLLYLPKNKDKAPIFLGYNFSGNHTVTFENDVVVTKNWVRNNVQTQAVNNKASEQGRGSYVSRWPIKEIISHGFGVATLYYGDIDPDYDDEFKNGVHQLYKEQRDSSSWGTIAAWSWGLSRVMDYLETNDKIDISRVFLIGHSRLGKAALWAAASDKRFAGVISNNSGCGGAAISRRELGETVKIINNSFPHWFNDNFKKYNNKVNLLPVDQHQLISLIAPRPVYIASASEDLWADPKGEYLSGYFATPVYELLGKDGLKSEVMPKVNYPLQQGYIAFHLREGDHDITLYDWQQYLNYFERFK